MEERLTRLETGTPVTKRYPDIPLDVRSVGYFNERRTIDANQTQESD